MSRVLEQLDTNQNSFSNENHQKRSHNRTKLEKKVSLTNLKQEYGLSIRDSYDNLPHSRMLYNSASHKEIKMRSPNEKIIIKSVK